MKKWMLFVFVLTIFMSCGDSDDEDFDPTRLDIVTGMNLKNDLGQAVEVWGNPNVSSTSSVIVFPNPAIETLRVQANTGIQNIWIVNGFPSRRFFDTNFAQVFADNPFQQVEIEAVASRTFDNLNGNTITLNVSDIAQGYYRLFVQLQNGTIILDNIYIDQSGNPDVTGINFWD